MNFAELQVRNQVNIEKLISFLHISNEYWKMKFKDLQNTTA